jgi:hypothetical protein
MADIEALKRSVAAKGTDGRCGACGKNEWNVATSAYVLTAVGEDGVEFGQGTEVLPVFCRNCGLARLHAVDYL